MTSRSGHRGIVLLPTDFSANWIDWMVRSGLNVLKLHMLQSQDDLLPFLESAKGREVLLQAEAAGIAIEYEIHAFSLFLPRSLFAQHPDWFRMDIRGNRIPDKNLCPSNQDALATLRKAALVWADRLRPTTHRHFLWPDDGAEWCHCPQCAPLSGADQNVLAANVVVDALRSADPRARLACLAYHSTLTPPSQTTPDPALFLEWAPIQRCYQHAIDDEACALNREILVGLRALLEVFDPADAQVLEYWMDASMFSRWQRPATKLPVDVEIMTRDVDAYNALGIGSVASFGCFLDADYVALHGEPPVQEYADALRRLR